MWVVSETVVREACAPAFTETKTKIIFRVETPTITTPITSHNESMDGWEVRGVSVVLLILAFRIVVGWHPFVPEVTSFQLVGFVWVGCGLVPFTASVDQPGTALHAYTLYLSSSVSSHPRSYSVTPIIPQLPIRLVLVVSILYSNLFNSFLVGILYCTFSQS